MIVYRKKIKDNGTQKAVQRQRMGILLCEQNFRDVWRRNQNVRAEIGQILHTHTHTHTHASQLVVRILQTIKSRANTGLSGLFPSYPTLELWTHRHKLRSHEHCEVNYLGRLEIIHLENIVGTRSSRRRISGVDSRSSTPGGGFGHTPYLNSLQIVVGTQSVPDNPLHILQPCAVGYPR